MFRKLAATVAVSTALITPSAWPLGLGKIDADSGLNQPLKAEITLLSSRNVSEEDLRAKLASYESYSKFGVRREAYHNTLRFKIVTKNDGSKVILVESRDPIKEPFINFLIELNWAQGRLMREYTLLLDPPVFAKTTPTPRPKTTPTTQRQQVTATQPSQPTEVSRTFDTPPKPKSKPKKEEPKQPDITDETRQLASSAEFNDDNWTVERGETLWSIAQSVRPEGVSVQQTLLAIFHNNPSAFINNDMNRVKAGAVLKVPESNVISDVSQAAAVSEIRSSTVTNDAPLDVRKSIEETEVEETEGQGGRLSIASVEESSSEQSGGSDLEGAMDEELTASDADDSGSLVSDGDGTASNFDSELSATDSESGDGLAVEDETLSVLSGSADKVEEGRLGDAEPQLADTNEAETLTEKSEAGTVGSSDEAAVEAKEDDAEVAKSEPNTTNTLQQNSEKAFYESDDFWLYAGGGLVLVLLIGGGLIYRRNHQVEDDGGLLGMMADANESKQQNKHDSFLQGQGMKAPQEESDPVSEADILIARGNLKKAESLLEDALAAEPYNQDIRVKLMEVVASSQNVEKFNQLKDELPADFDHDSTLGLKVASLSSLLVEEQPEMNVEESSDFDLPSEGDIFGEDGDNKNVDLDLSDELESSTTDVDTVGDMDEVESDDGDILDLDLGDFEEQVKEPSSESADSASGDNSIEFTTSQDDEELVTQEDDSTSNDTPDSSAADQGLSADDAATKFDLAKAYLELGDDEAARDILEEVKQEGNSEQRAEADKLLSQM
ncbi:FimV/HubP family polar landmark protein [Kangiella shandongensis]|uniref:FimV/HubP family polar landmark protein n=1 Tax=Kangiella shandongensis TaxID=2763258 RepID=UPI001CC0F5DA|nr:FimV/HubP family polar landmark protein [Kangiella shandongensis]